MRKYILLFLAMWCSYLFTAPGHIDRTDGWTRYIVAESIVEYGRPIIGEEYVGVLGDLWVVPGVDNNYSFYGIGQSAAMVPLYMVGRWVGSVTGGFGAASIEQFFVSFINTIVGALLAISVFHLARNLGFQERTAFRLVLMVGFGTIVWVHTRDSYDHIWETFCVTSAMAMLVYAMNHGASPLVLLGGGLLAATGMVTRVSTAFAFPAFTLLLFIGLSDASPQWREVGWWRQGVRNCLWFSAGVLPGVLLNLWYNAVRFGSWYATGYEDRVPYWFSHPIWLGLANFLVSPGRGLLLYVPLVLALPFIIKGFWKHTPRFTLVIVVMVLTYVLMYAQFGGLGRWAWGPHYLLPVVPLLILPWGNVIENWAQFLPRKRVILTALIGVSLLIQCMSVCVSYTRTLVRATVAGYAVDTSYDWQMEWSLLPQQGNNIVHVLRTMAAGREFQSETVVTGDNEYRLENELSLNVLDWWWVLAMYRGIRWAWIVALLLLLVSGVALRRMNTILI